MPDQVSLKFPDGSAREFPSGVTGAEIAGGISKSLAKKSVAYALNGELRDLADPIEDDGAIEIVLRSDERALHLNTDTLEELAVRGSLVNRLLIAGAIAEIGVAGERPRFER